MAYVNILKSDPWSTISAPTADVRALLANDPRIKSVGKRRYEIPSSQMPVSIRLAIDEVDEEGNSAEEIRRRRAGQPWEEDYEPKVINIIYSSFPDDIPGSLMFGGMMILWDIADQLGWRILDYQADQFVRPRYDGVAYLPGDLPVADAHRRMAMAMKSAGASRASQSRATPCDHGRIHGFWGEWSMTMRLCNAPFAAREARFRAQRNQLASPWDKVSPKPGLHRVLGTYGQQS